MEVCCEGSAELVALDLAEQHPLPGLFALVVDDVLDPGAILPLLEDEPLGDDGAVVLGVAQINSEAVGASPSVYSVASLV